MVAQWGAGAMKPPAAVRKLLPRAKKTVVVAEEPKGVWWVLQVKSNGRVVKSPEYTE